MYRFLVFMLILILPGKIFAQADAGIKLTTFSGHPFAKTDLDWHQKTIDGQGYLTFEPGLSADIYMPLINRVRIGAEVQAVSDRFNGFTGAVGINISGFVFKYWKNRLFITIGPKLYVYQNRELPEDYTGDEGYKTEGAMPRKFMPLTGSIEYSYDLSKTTRFMVGLGQTHPKSAGITAGFRFILPGGGGKGCDCPSYR
jgi:hypothetical protein